MSASKKLKLPTYEERKANEAKLIQELLELAQKIEKEVKPENFEAVFNMAAQLRFSRHLN